jgi:hypothetical protein
MAALMRRTSFTHHSREKLYVNVVFHVRLLFNFQADGGSL